MILEETMKGTEELARWFGTPGPWIIMGVLIVGSLLTLWLSVAYMLGSDYFKKPKKKKFKKDESHINKY